MHLFTVVFFCKDTLLAFANRLAFSLFASLALDRATLFANLAFHRTTISIHLALFVFLAAFLTPVFDTQEFCAAIDFSARLILLAADGCRRLQCWLHRWPNYNRPKDNWRACRPDSRHWTAVERVIYPLNCFNLDSFPPGDYSCPEACHGLVPEASVQKVIADNTIEANLFLSAIVVNV
jgi:hypothetical protein